MADGPLNERQRDSTVNILGILVVLCVPNGASIGMAQQRYSIIARVSQPLFARVRATTGQGDLWQELRKERSQKEVQDRTQAIATGCGVSRLGGFADSAVALCDHTIMFEIKRDEHITMEPGCNRFWLHLRKYLMTYKCRHVMRSQRDCNGECCCGLN
jgi:hypothetical protein